MGARKARLAHAIRTGEAVPPPVAPERFNEETVLLPKHVTKLVAEEHAACRYKMTRAQYLAKLVEAAANHERELREQRESEHNLIVPATHLPPGTAEAAKRLEALKHGPR